MYTSSSSSTDPIRASSRRGDSSPESLEREANSSESFSSLDFLSNQTDLVYSRSPRDVDNVDNVVKKQLRVTLDEHCSFISGLKDFRELISQILLGHNFLID